MPWSADAGEREIFQQLPSHSQAHCCWGIPMQESVCQVVIAQFPSIMQGYAFWPSRGEIIWRVSSGPNFELKKFPSKLHILHIFEFCRFLNFFLMLLQIRCTSQFGHAVFWWNLMIFHLLDFPLRLGGGGVSFWVLVGQRKLDGGLIGGYIVWGGYKYILKRSIKKCSPSPVWQLASLVGDGQLPFQRPAPQSEEHQWSLDKQGQGLFFP